MKAWRLPAAQSDCSSIGQTPRGNVSALSNGSVACARCITGKRRVTHSRVVATARIVYKCPSSRTRVAVAGRLPQQRIEPIVFDAWTQGAPKERHKRKQKCLSHAIARMRLRTLQSKNTHLADNYEEQAQPRSEGEGHGKT